MASLLDVGLLKHFEVIFPFLLILVLGYAGLSRFKGLSEKPAFTALIAFILAITSVMSSVVVKTVGLMAPWFVLLFIFSLFALIAYQSLGISEDSILKVITGTEYGKIFTFWILALILIIGFGSLFTVLSQGEGGVLGGRVTGSVNETSTGASEFFNTLFHPKLLGLGLILLIAVFTINRIAED